LQSTSEVADKLNEINLSVSLYGNIHDKCVKFRGSPEVGNPERNLFSHCEI